MIRNLLKKELHLASSPLAFFFILAGLLSMCPGYPILLSGFFTCLGLFQSFQYARESNDIVYSALLPIRKSDVVRGKYIFCLFIEGCSFILSAICTIIRMTILSNSAVYRENALMGANLIYLGYLLVIFGLFNLIFLGLFFKTAYKYGKPFILFIIASFLVISIAEATFHFPGCEALNSFGFDNLPLQLIGLIIGIILFIFLTILSENRAKKNFEKIDL